MPVHTLIANFIYCFIFIYVIQTSILVVHNTLYLNHMLYIVIVLTTNAQRYVLDTKHILSKGI